MQSQQSAVISGPRANGSSDSDSSNGLEARMSQYQCGDFYDEMFDPEGQPRPDCQPLYARMQTLSSDDLTRRQRAADRSMVQLGITFNVYGDQQGRERIIP